jgi:hypothetical protein
MISIINRGKLLISMNRSITLLTERTTIPKKNTKDKPILITTALTHSNSRYTLLRRLTNPLRKQDIEAKVKKEIKINH